MGFGGTFFKAMLGFLTLFLILAILYLFAMALGAVGSLSNQANNYLTHI